MPLFDLKTNNQHLKRIRKIKDAFPNEPSALIDIITPNSISERSIPNTEEKKRIENLIFV